MYGINPPNGGNAHGQYEHQSSKVNSTDHNQTAIDTLLQVDEQRPPNNRNSSSGYGGEKDGTSPAASKGSQNKSTKTVYQK